ncbi:MAG: hypothetical protein QNJ64_08430 [Crocosphaera sp.]|nr:hypothetical protein [Crocosphaera sp.]
MIRSANFNTLVDGCDHIEQLFDLCARALYDRYPSSYVTTGVASTGADIKSRNINHWTGSLTIENNIAEEFSVINYTTKVDKGHKASQTPWLLVKNLGSDTDTPGGIFA